MENNQNGQKYVNLSPEGGFTLLEMLFALSIFCMIAFFIPLLIQVIYTHYPEDELQRLEWEVFINQVKKEVRFAEDIYVKNNVLYLKKGKYSIVTYERFRNKLRRRVGGQGHELLLQNVRDATFEQLKNGAKLTVIDSKNRRYEVKLRSYLQLPGGVSDDE